jgi:hypothetical protein
VILEKTKNKSALSFSLIYLTLSTILVLLFQGVSIASWVLIFHKFVVNGKVIEGSMRDIDEATGESLQGQLEYYSSCPWSLLRAVSIHLRFIKRFDLRFDL